jgi:hypothetical protein
MNTCNQNEQSVVIGTGGVCTNLESKTKALFLVANDFKATYDQITTKTGWNTLVKEKKIVPLYEIYELANANTEATYFETGNFKYETNKAVKTITAELYLSLCAHTSLASYENSKYNRIIEVTESNEIVLVKKFEDGDGEQATSFLQPYYTGQLIKSFFVGIRNSATKDKSPFTPLKITYDNYDELEKYGVIIKPDTVFDVIADVEKIVNLSVENYVNADGDFVLKVSKSCTQSGLAGLTGVNISVKLNNVAEVVILTDNGSGLYTLALTSGNPFPNGNHVFSTVGVIEVGGLLYEILPTTLFTAFN